MIWTADRIVHGGFALSGWGLRVAPNGRVQELAPLSRLPPPEVTLAGRALWPGRIDPYHQCLGYASELLVTRLDPREYYAVARAAFVRLLQCGVTCVGECYTLRGGADDGPHPATRPMLEALVAAARDAGIRLGIIDTVRLGCATTHDPAPPARMLVSDLEAACERFEHLIGYVLAQQDPKLSWALGVHSFATVPYPELVALRVQLGHMPFFLPLTRSADFGAEAELISLGARGVLDAGVTIVTVSPLSAPEQFALAQAGSHVCVCLKPGGVALQPSLADMLRAAGVAPASCFGSDGAPAQVAAEALGRLSPHAVQRANDVAARSLGVDAGGFWPGQWADFVAVSLSAGTEDGANGALQIGEAWHAQTRAAAIRDVVVGGKAIICDGVHLSAAASATDMARLKRPP